MKIASLVLLACLATTSAFAGGHHHSHHGVLHDSLRGSPRSLANQNIEADREHLTRLKESQIPVFKRKHLLVPLPAGRNVVVNRRLPPRYRYVRPWARNFLARLGGDFRHKFQAPIQINSALRSIEYQKKLRHRNGNAAMATAGLRQSSHPTGATVDIAKNGMSQKELGWMRSRLRKANRAKLAQATEEHKQPVFHVMIFNRHKTGHHRQQFDTHPKRHGALA